MEECMKTRENIRVKEEIMVDKEEIQIAHRFQHRFLTKYFPDIDDFHFDIMYIPSYELRGVSYNIYPVNSNHAFGYLADASIWGIDANVFTMLLNGIIEDFIQKQSAISIPIDLITYVRENLPIDVFSENIPLTMMSFYLDTVENRIAIANTENQNPPIWSNGKTSSFITTKGISINSNLLLKEKNNTEVKLLPGEKILFYTNGVINKGMFGFKELKSVFKQNFNASSPLHSIAKEFLLSTKERDFNDVAMLLISNDKQPYHVEFLSPDSFTAILDYSLVRFISPFVKEILNCIHRVEPNLDDEKHRYVLLESITNAVEHGNLDIDVNREFPMYKKLYRERSRERIFYSKKVRVRIEIRKDIQYEIMDEGKGFNWHKILKESDDERYMNEKTRGRGIYILKRISSSISFNDKGNIIRLSVPK